MILRPARASDLEQLAALDAATLEPSWSDAVYRHELEREDGLFLVAADGSGVRGFVVARRFADHGEILRLAVGRSARRRGVGTRLARAALRRLAELAVDRCWLELREDNAAARALYESLGFRVSGRRPRYYSDGAAALLMERSGL